MSATIASGTLPFAGGMSPSERAGSTAPPRRRRREDEFHFRLIVAATFPAFYLVALVLRPLRSGSTTGPRPSCFREAKAAARTCGSLALLG